MRHLNLSLASICAVALLVGLPASASAATSGKRHGYALRFTSHMGYLTIPKSQISSGASHLWTVRCAKRGHKPKMVMGVSPITDGQRRLNGPIAGPVKSRSICRVELDGRLVARITVRR